MRSLINMPLVPNTTMKPSFTACRAMSRMSGRTSGSPPVMTSRQPLFTSAIWSMRRIAFFGRQLIGSAAGFRRRIEIAMVALEIAALGEIQRDEIGFEVIDGATVVDGAGASGWRE